MVKFFIAFIFIQIVLLPKANQTKLSVSSDDSKIDSLREIVYVPEVAEAKKFEEYYNKTSEKRFLDSTVYYLEKCLDLYDKGLLSKSFDILRVVDHLRTVYEKKGDYKQVIVYNNLWDKKIEEFRANEAKKLQLQFEVEMKEAELKQLYAAGVYHENRLKLIILTCALLCLSILFLVFYIQLKKRNLNSRIARIDADRAETKLKLRLKEEQTVKMQLEKYMALSDFRLKELELIGKTNDLEHLYADKEELDKQVELFRRKVEAFDVSIEKEEHEDSDIQFVITEDLRRLFSKQSATKYIEKLENLKKSGIDTIIEKSNGSLSVSYLKYCVCFAIGMGINEVAECFNIEQTSVHMIRYRLKKKFGLSNDDDLCLFLQEKIYE